MPAIKIELNNLRFHAHHGIHPEEKKMGNHFEVNVRCSYEVNNEVITSIAQTADYAAIFRIVKDEMAVPRELLETLAMQTVEKIHTAFPRLNNISYTISKLYPPISGLQGNISVQFSSEY